VNAEEKFLIDVGLIALIYYLGEPAARRAKQLLWRDVLTGHRVVCGQHRKRNLGIAIACPLRATIHRGYSGPNLGGVGGWGLKVRAALCLGGREQP
jgi:hypothetical protein